LLRHQTSWVCVNFFMVSSKEVIDHQDNHDCVYDGHLFIGGQ